MRSGTPLGHGFKSHQKVLVTSRRLHLDRMPGVVTGCSPGYLRVRIIIPTTNGNGVVSVWCKLSEVRKAR